MFYQALLAYFTVKFIGELFLGDDIPETDIRPSNKCNCPSCSGIHILNK